MKLKPILNFVNLKILETTSGFPTKEWKTIAGGGVLREHIFLFEKAKESTKPIVEIGAYIGKSTFSLAEGSIRGNKQTVFSIDPHTPLNCADGFNYPNTKRAFLENVSKSTGNHLIDPIYDFSNLAVKEWELPIGFLFIDGDHSYKSVKEDFKLWHSFVSYKGIVAFHDSSLESVAKFLKEMEHNAAFALEGKCSEITWFTKVEES